LTAVGRPAPAKPALPVKAPTPPAPAELAGAVAAYQKSPTPELADRLVSAGRPLLNKAMRAYVGTESPAARAKAKSILLQAAARYDPKTAKPETYFLTHLQSLRRYGANLAAPVRVPDRVRLDAPRVDRHAEDLRLELGREPSDAEIADRSGLPVDRIAKARGVGAAFVGATVPEGLAYVTPGPVGAARSAWARYVYHDLKSPVAQLVMEHSMGLNGKPVLSTNEIARLAGVSPGAISQHKAKIDRMLAEYESFVGGG
jgi:hypothetical protein